MADIHPNPDLKVPLLNTVRRITVGTVSFLFQTAEQSGTYKYHSGSHHSSACNFLSKDGSNYLVTTVWIAFSS
jgi:hypothetical protein